ncbi:conserved Plasmodium protein, unknown function [Plasmodium gallinaceum]|uniref:Endoplasmic reticulum transmembrane protein n=1 Tax=Plasmodium gallinaceum TaxID=5849 RepID=A0A1J1GXR8_PLAGA|nr:conserved Plasmodium protein, unknown function [Plasmodium gallinaceum]CRG95800.1 conserved Plasmodium protein, unknown function [Plasmodium gallinaceum]
MKDIAFFFLPGGIILSIFLLSGVAMLQSLAISLQKKSINFQIQSHKINISISSIISLYSLLRLSYTILELNKYNNEKVNFENINSLNLNRSYLKKMRLQRNFWILLLCSITWIFYIRFTYLLKYYREKVKKSDQEFEKILEGKKFRDKKLENKEELENKDELKSENEVLTNEDESNEEKEENVDDKVKSSILVDKNKKKVELRQRR